jgi:MFS family permease
MNRRILLSASLFHGLNDAASAIVPMVFPILYAQGRLISSYVQIGILSNAGLLITLLFQLVVAQTSERFEFRTILLGSLAGIAGALCLLTTASSFLVLLAAYALFRLFVSFYHPLGIAWVSRTHPSGAIDRAMGIQGGSGDLGVLVAYLFAGALLVRGGWRTPLFAWAAVVLVFGALAYLGVRRVSTRNETFVPPRLDHWTSTLKQIRAYVPGIVFVGAGWAMVVYYAPALFHLKFRDSLAGTGLVLAAWIGVGTLMSFLFGRLSRAFGRMTLTIAGCSLSGVGLLVLGLAPSRWVAVGGIVVLGLALFLLYPAFQSFVGNAVPHARQAVAFSLVANIQVLSGAVLTLVAGVMADLFGLGSAFVLTGGLGLAAGAFYGLRRPDVRMERVS